MGFELGRYDVVDRLLAEAEQYGPGPLQRGQDRVDPGDVSQRHPR
jgi:hypothetical protein